MMAGRSGIDATPDGWAEAKRNQLARRRLGLLLVILSALAWSTAGFFTRLIPVDAWTMLFWRGVFGALTGFAFVVIQEGQNWRQAFTRIGRYGVLFTLMSTVGMIAFLSSLKLTSVAHVAIIYAAIPFVAAALAWLVLRERVSAPTLLASTAALLGVVLTVAGSSGEGSLVGDGLAVLMTLTMGGMMVVARAAPSTIPMVPAACLSAALTALVSLPFASPSAVSGPDLAYLALFGITNMGLGLIFFTLGARMIPAAQTALIGALDAPLAPAWVWLAFGETPGLATMVGGSVVMVAVLAHVWWENRAPRAA
jgi:drug/metabolite transporter (DMT)-like permease